MKRILMKKVMMVTMMLMLLVMILIILYKKKKQNGKIFILCSRISKYLFYLYREYRWDRDHLKLFIKMIKQHPLLYDTQHKDYTNNAARKIELNKLLQKVKKLDSKITMNIMRQKIRSLRTQYQREVRYLKMAYEKNEFYIPKLWCFDKLSNLYNDDLTPFYKKDDKVILFKT